MDNTIDFSIDIEDIDFNIDDFRIEADFEIDRRYIKPLCSPIIPEKKLCYEKAEELADDIDLTRRNYVYVSGNFYFGDFIEGLLVKRNIKAKRMLISTLSMNQNNVDSLKNLLRGDYIDRLDMVVSAYFFSHERSGLIPYIYSNLDIGNKFQLAVAGSHCKIYQFETDYGDKIVIYGSANMRSSGNLEQIVIEKNSELYDYNKEVHDRIIEKYFTINHPIRRRKLWQAVAQNQKKERDQAQIKRPRQASESQKEPLRSRA